MFLLDYALPVDARNSPRTALTLTRDGRRDGDTASVDRIVACRPSLPKPGQWRVSDFRQYFVAAPARLLIERLTPRVDLIPSALSGWSVLEEWPRAATREAKLISDSEPPATTATRRLGVTAHAAHPSAAGLSEAASTFSPSAHPCERAADGEGCEFSHGTTPY